MRKIAIAAGLLFAVIIPAFGQSFNFPPPVAPNNTNFCLAVSSLTQVNGIPIGQSSACFAVPDATTGAILSAYGAACSFHQPSPCTTQQVLAYIANDVQAHIASFVRNVMISQATDGVPQLAVTPLPPQ